MWYALIYRNAFRKDRQSTTHRKGYAWKLIRHPRLETFLHSHRSYSGWGIIEATAAKARHHSDAPSTHPLLSLMHSTNTPNCHLKEILIPEPSPHLKLFVVSSTTILPYTPLRIRPPPEPPPTQQRPISATKGIRSESNNTSLITSYFKRSST